MFGVDSQNVASYENRCVFSKVLISGRSINFVDGLYNYKNKMWSVGLEWVERGLVTVLQLS